MRDHVHEKAAQELVRVERHDLLCVGMAGVAVTERDAIAVEGDEAGVGDGDAVCVVGQIPENLSGSAKGSFGIDDPLPGGTASDDAEQGDSGRELQCAGSPCLSQRRTQQSAKTPR